MFSNFPLPCWKKTRRENGYNKNCSRGEIMNLVQKIHPWILFSRGHISLGVDIPLSQIIQNLSWITTKQFSLKINIDKNTTDILLIQVSLVLNVISRKLKFKSIPMLYQLVVFLVTCLCTVLEILQGKDLNMHIIIDFWLWLGFNK